MQVDHDTAITNLLQELIEHVAREPRTTQSFLNSWSADFNKEVEAYIQFRIAKAKQDEQR